MRGSGVRFAAIRVAPEPQALEQVGNDSVAFRGNVYGGQALGPGALCVARDAITHRLFDASVQHAATHQPCVHVPLFGCPRADHNADHAVVAKLVANGDLQCVVIGGVLQRGNLLFGVPPRGHIELIGLVDELTDPFAAARVEAGELDLHLQRTQEVIEIAGPFEGLGTFRVALVGLCARQIFLREAHGFEVARRQ